MKKAFILIVTVLSLTFAGQAATVSSSSAAAAVKSEKKKVEVRTVVFQTNLHCKMCAKKIEDNIAFEKGVKGLEINVQDKTVKVTFDASRTNEETLAAAIRKLGYTAQAIAEK